MFKNFFIYNYATDNIAELVENLVDKEPFYPCAAAAFSSNGWAPVTPDGVYSVSVSDGTLLAFRQQYKVVPIQLIKDKLAERIVEVERNTGRRPGKKERRDLRDDVIIGLLPDIIPRNKLHYVWFGQNGRLIIEASSAGDADRIVNSIVRQAAKGFHISCIPSERSVASAAADWLLNEDGVISNNLDLGRHLKMQSVGDSKSTVTIANLSLINNEQVQKFLREGHTVKSVEVCWEGSSSVTVTDTMVFKRFSVDMPKEKDEDAQSAFESDAYVHVLTINNILSGLLRALS